MRNFEIQLDIAAHEWDNVYSQDNVYAFKGGAQWLKEQSLENRLTDKELNKVMSLYYSGIENAKFILEELLTKEFFEK